jgi:ParB family chromosome partitioning protein
VSAEKRGLQRRPQATEDQDQLAKRPAPHPLADRPAPDIRALVVPLSKIQPSEDQPRQTFHDETIQELADDIEQHGLINPRTVYEDGDVFRLVAGERRYRALTLLEREEASVRVVDRESVRKIQLAENVQREDLPLVEEALALKELQKELDATQRDLADYVNKSKSYVNRRLQILEMPDDVQAMLREQPGLLTQAQKIAKIQDPERRQKHIEELLSGGEAVEDPAKTTKPKSAPGRPPAEAVRFTSKKRGGFDLVVKHRPGKTDRDEIIEQLRSILEKLETADN